MYNAVIQQHGVPTQTEEVALTAGWASLATLLGKDDLLNAAGQAPVACWLGVTFVAANTGGYVGFGDAPGGGHELIREDVAGGNGDLWIYGQAAINALKVKRYAAGTAANMTVTLFY
jgi:hypothetical protein